MCMTNSQRETGFTKVPNHLLHAMISTELKLSGADFRVLLFIFNQTFGYQHEKWQMSASYIAKATGLSIRQVRRSVANLQNWNIVRLYPAENAVNVLGINDATEQWEIPDEHGNQFFKKVPLEKGDVPQGQGDNPDRTTCHLPFQGRHLSKLISVPDETVTPDEAVTPDEVVTPDEAVTPDETVTPDEAVTPDKAVTVTELSHTPDKAVTIPPDRSVTQNKKERQERENKKELCACPFFETLWAEYPNKKGKAKVTQKAMGEMNRLGYGRMHRALERYRTEKPEWQHWQNGSTFFNGGYLDYLDEAPGKEQTNGADDTDGAGDNWKRFFERCRI